MKTPTAPIEPLESAERMSPEDMESAARAAAAQEQGTAMIREHLSSHLEQNPNSTYVTWVACLHPENATVAIDPRFYVPGNPWMTVFEEAKANELPTAHATLVVDGEDSDESSEADVTGQTASKPAATGGPLGMLIGGIILVAAVATTFGLELTALIVYLVSFAFAKTASALHKDLNVFTVLFFAIFFFVWKLLSFIDILLLFLSVIFSEIMAAICTIPTTLVGGCCAGQFWHQKIRKTCHLTRWATRAKFETWDPPRSIPLTASVPPPESAVQQVEAQEVYTQAGVVVHKSPPETTVVSIEDVKVDAKADAV
uniref:Transmembrane protein n=1 Tax=Grammatophora oceanica TaxID=210454 RepID=A0A7S1Y4M9_9STRA|mmetsp:Transcript_19943/g.29539  ORF Transcript_19943/g.29539 Transcript_19943/m.29539 type:complete len:313 (+) Transcript_19943:52-990(+)